MLLAAMLVAGCFPESPYSSESLYSSESIIEREKAKTQVDLDKTLISLDQADSLNDFLEIQRDNWKLGLLSLEPNFISEKRRQWYVDNRNDLSVEMKEIVLSGKWRIGMTRNDLYASIGIPKDINRSVYTFGVHEQWFYNYDIRVPRTTDIYFYFEDGILTSWQD